MKGKKEMFHSLNSCEGDIAVDYDVCIVGSGIAAHSILHKITSLPGGKHKRIAVLEGSTQSQRRVHRIEQEVEYYPIEQDIYSGEIAGWIQESQPEYLITSRQRAYGGTTNIWSGWCWPLEKMDMEERRIRKGFQWPISYKDMERYFQQAQEFCGLSSYQYESPDFWVKELKDRRIAKMDLDGTSFRTRMLYFNPSTIYEYYAKDFHSSPHIDIYTNAHCLTINWEKVGQNDIIVKDLTVSSIVNGKPTKNKKIRAKKYIIAAGCFETTRILINSDLDKVNPYIGKNFMEHPYLWVASEFKFNQIPEAIKNFYFPKHPIPLPSQVGIIPAIVPIESFIEKHGIGNFRVLLGGAPHIPGTINISWEQMPNLESRISLSNMSQKDIFGQRRLKIENKISDTDRKTLIYAIKSTVSLLSTLGYGKDFKTPDFNMDPWSWEAPWRIVPGNHPMGTTSMSSSTENGVVNSDCKVHGTKNLYIASSSVFPTAGYANSTFTLIALALRLGDHIAEG